MKNDESEKILEINKNLQILPTISIEEIIGIIDIHRFDSNVIKIIKKNLTSKI